MLNPQREYVRPRSSRGSAPDGLRVYLERVGRCPLLDREDEIRLAQLRDAGTVAAGVLRAQPSHRRRRDLRATVERGERARRELVLSNLRLVVFFALRERRPTTNVLDLIQDGNVGLLKAAERYDWRRGHRFSTYAWWIREAMARGHRSANLVRLPRGHPEHDAACSTPARAQEVRIASLDAVVGDSEQSLVEVLADQTTLSPEAHAIEHAAQAEVRAALDHLDPRAREVVELRYAIGGTAPVSATSVGERLGVTRQRIWQIEQMAFDQLRDVLRHLAPAE